MASARWRQGSTSTWSSRPGPRSWPPCSAPPLRPRRRIHSRIVWLHADTDRDPGAGELVSAEPRFRKVLVVDDDEHLCAALQRGLRKDRDVRTATTAIEAIRIGAALRPDLAVIDLQIGTDSGIEVVRKLRAQLEDATIVVMTGYGSID